jgi:hypothetical protein
MLACDRLEARRRQERRKLAKRFEIDLGPCVSFIGNVGDVIQIALHEPSNPDVQRYHLACRIW